MIAIQHDRDNYLVCRVSGQLTEADYAAAIPELENELFLRDGPLRLMIVLEDFRGRELSALWKELKFDVRRSSDFDRIAVLGASRMADWGAHVSLPLLGSEVCYVDRAERAAARAWLSEGRELGAPPATD